MSSIVLLPLVAKIMSAKGQFVGTSWIRPVKTLKGINSVVTKSVRTVVQVGVDYDKREVVKEARADGTAPEKNAGLPWGEWAIFPYVITHKGEQYVRLYPVKNTDGTPRACKVIYRIDGKISTKAEAQKICLASEFSEGKATECYTLKAINLRSVRFGGSLLKRSQAKETLVSVPLAQASLV